ncbi:unnamed protein product [Phytomonas sp. EM1]|nr:unnamed protein product [Phytomonas sp. EM1]|eukprot:CCW61876.1 unnamed protein product [Phytomonas sp. isolate EM1]
MLINILSSQEQYTINGLEVEPNQTVASLCREIATRLSIQNLERIRLVFCGRLLHNDRSLGEYDISDGSTVHMVIRSEETINSRAEQPTRQSTNTSGTHTLSVHASTGAFPLSDIGSLIGSIISQQLQNTTTNIPHTEPLFAAGANVLNSIFTGFTSSGDNNAQREAAGRRPQSHAPATQPRASARAASMTEESEAVRPAHAHPSTASAEVPVAGVYLHVHCNLSEVDLLPERLGRVMQRMNRNHESRMPGISNVEIHFPHTAHEQSRSEEQSPTSVEVPSFMNMMFERLTADLSWPNIVHMLSGDLSFIREKREAMRQYLNEHHAQYYSHIDNSEESQGGNRARLQAIADYEGDFLIPIIMAFRHVQEVLSELTTEAERDRITSELKNVMKHFIYKLLNLILSLEPTDDVQWAKKVINLILDVQCMIVKRAKDKWFHEHVEPSLVIRRLYDAFLREVFETPGNDEANALYLSLLREVAVPAFERSQRSYETSRNDDPEDQEEIFTRWRDAIAKEESTSEAELNDVLLEALEALDDQQEPEHSSLADVKSALAEWAQLGGSHAEAAERVRQLLARVRERPVESNTPPGNDTVNPHPQTKTSPSFCTEYLAEFE